MVAFLGLDDCVNIGGFIESFVRAAGYPEPTEIFEAMAAKPNIPVTIFIDRHRLWLSLLVVQESIPLAALEVGKVADLLLVVAPIYGNAKAHARIGIRPDDVEPCAYRVHTMSEKMKVSSQVDSALTLLCAQGLPTTICALRGLCNVPRGKRSASRTAATDAISKLLKHPTHHLKALAADSPVEFLELVRQVAVHACAQPKWRSARPYVLAERISILSSVESPDHACITDDLTVTVSVEGYVRGTRMTANQLVHLPGVGDFPVESISEIPEERETYFKNPKHHRESASRILSTDSNSSRVHLPDPNLCDVPVRINLPDTLAGEQTWPTAQDMIESHTDDAIVRHSICTIDSGVVWIDHVISSNILNEPARDTYIESPGMGIDHAVCQDMSGPFGLHGGDGDENHESTFLDSVENDSGGRGEAQMYLDDTRRDSAARVLLEADEQNRCMFPDEVETPLHISARNRFARYRGLKSFRSSRWDPKEALPPDYSKVFAFKNFRRATYQATQTSTDHDRRNICVGTFVQVIIRGVPRAAANVLLLDEKVQDPVSPIGLIEGVVGKGVGPVWNGWNGGAGPLILSALLQHESRLTVMHYGVTKTTSYEVPFRSKTPLWFHIGFRRERAAPIFSTDGPGDKHKFERFLPSKKLVVASVYGPVVFPPAPVLGLQEEYGSGGLTARLVFSGNVRKSDPDRIILKRIVLTGIPFKTHKSKAVVRQMFFCPEDIRWFKPLELWTKYGMRGKIKEAVGTHGHMKCVFNGVIQQQDTVCATLYKRVFPKFLKV